MTVRQSSLRESSNAQQAAKSRRARGSISGTTIATYLGVFLLIVSMIALAYHPPVNQKVLADAASNTSTQQTQVQTTENVSVDQLVATNLASSLAESTDMPISNNVANLSQTLSVESVLAQTDSNVISKPQIIQPTADGRTLQYYVAVAGDTVPAVAAKYSISAQTIQWTNNLTSEALTPGQKLTILPTDGVLYTVKSGDTLDSIVAKYGADRASITAFNDLELAGNPAVGTQLILPGAVLPNSERPGYVAPSTGGSGSSYSGGYGNSYLAKASVGNRYAWGNCTWYAYERRMQLGMPVGSFWGNASSWAAVARSAGYLVDGNPTPGAVMQNGGGYGHVAIVESVNPGVSVTISEMNGYRFGGGFARVGHGDIPWSEAVSGYYSYIH
ncbi:MAG TPA: CHAP domain-containing protein [Patescibacteria group bacterium]|nr:CHAP domain-containing protein [Patescibacteria group bacterium]